MSMTTTQSNPQDHSVSPKGMLIGGQWVESASSARITVENPAKRKPVAEVPRGNAADVDRAVTAATKAYADWRKVPPRERGKALLKIAEALQSRAEEIARTISLETGNALRTQARGEATMTADIFRYFGGLGSELKGETIPLGEHVLSYTRREPLGVVGAIIPWNAPVMLAALKIAPALCAGNTMVMKAAEDAPLGVLLLAEICQQFLPPGVLNLLTGFGEEVGGPLLNHPGIRKLSFTGSTEVGKIVMRAAAERIVPVSLELGGKSPSIVYPDADEDWAVDGIIAAMRFTRQSQSCTAGSRLFLHEDIFDSFLAKLEKKTTALKIGDPLDEKTDIGTIINNKQFTKVCKYVDEGLKRSDAKLVFGGLPPKTGPLSEGYYAIPTVFAWHARRFLGRCWWRSAGATRPRRSAWPTTAITGSRPMSGRTTSAPACGPRMPSNRAGYRSTRAWARCRACPTAATSRAASAASSRSRACWTASPSART
jgi:acyl-CoA reductase-like NAD-dependent aldehyde dehydrogenase